MRAEFCLENLRGRGTFGELEVDMKEIKSIFKKWIFERLFHRPSIYFNGSPLQTIQRSLSLFKGRVISYRDDQISASEEGIHSTELVTTFCGYSFFSHFVEACTLFAPNSFTLFNKHVIHVAVGHAGDTQLTSPFKKKAAEAYNATWCSVKCSDIIWLMTVS